MSKKGWGINKDYRLLMVAMLLIAVFQEAEAATWEVCHSECIYSSIQSAINATNNGDTVLVHKGTYYENIDFKGKTITIRSKSGPKKTIIDGTKSGSVVTFSSGEGIESVLEGFTITHGSGLDLWEKGSSNGGGVYCAKSSPTIKDCIITKNTATQDGGGIYCLSASPKIIDCIIRHNTANYHGGGIGCYASSPTIINCSITDNVADWGDAIACGESTTSTAIIKNCNIEGNMSDIGSE